MAEQILIELVSDTSKFSPAIDQMLKLGQITAADVELFNKQTAAFEKSTAAIQKGTQKSIKSVGDLKKGVDSVASAFQKGFKDGVAKGLEQSSATVDALKKKLKDLGDEEGNTDTKTKSLRAQLRAMREELAAMEEAGQEGTQRFIDMSVAAGQLADQMGDTQNRIRVLASDTKELDAGVEAVKGLASGFGLVTGAAALFGAENDAVAQSLQKIQAVMVVLQTLTEIQNLLQKQSTIAVLTNSAARGVQAVTTTAETAAEVANTEAAVANTVATEAQAVATGGASAAMRIFNSIVKANPIGFLIAAIGAVIGAFTLFISKSKAAERAQREFNAAIKAGTDYLNADLQGIESHYKKLDAAQKARGQSQNEANKNDIEQSRLRTKAVQEALDATTKAYNDERTINNLSAEDYAKLGEQVVTLTQQRNNEILDGNIKAAEQTRKLYEDQLKSAAAFADAKVSIARKGSIAELQAQIAATKVNLTAQNADPNLTPGEIVKNVAVANRAILEYSTQINIQLLQQHKDLLEEKLAQTKEGTLDELQLQKKISDKQFDIELLALENSEEKKAALLAQKRQADIDFQRQYTQRIAQLELTGINTRLAKAKEGSAEEFNLRLQALQKQSVIDQHEKGVTTEKWLEIDAKYFRDLAEMTKAFNKQVTEDAINTRQAQINAALADLSTGAIEDTNQEVLSLKKDLVDQQQALDIVSANFSIKNEELRQAKLKEIIAKASADKLALEQDYQNKIIAAGRAFANVTTDNEIKRQQLIANGNEFSFRSRFRALEQIKVLERSKLQGELDDLNEQLKKKLISQADYNQKKAELDGKYLDLELKQQQEHQAKKDAIAEAAFSTAQQISDALFEIGKAWRDKELEDTISNLEAAKDKELDNKNLTEQQKSNINEKYRQREAILKRQAAEKEKQAQINQAIINGLLAITKTFAAYGFTPAGILAAGAQAAATLIAIGKIKATPIPAYAKGVRNAPKGYAWVGEEGPEIVEMKGGERVYTYAESRKLAQTWSQKNLLPDLPISRNHNLSHGYSSTSTGQNLDYKKLGKELAKHIPAPVQNVINVDKNGITGHIMENGNKITIKNNRYKF